jgi:hypothetical protein
MIASPPEAGGSGLEIYLPIVAFLAASVVAARTALTCQRAQQRGLNAPDVPVWAGLAAVLTSVALVKLVRVLGLVSGWGQWLRELAKQHGAYAGRRPYQVASTLAVALAVAVLLLIGLVWVWHYIKRYRMAVGLASLVVGLGVIRFISLHEVDAWFARWPWFRAGAELIAAAGTAALAYARKRRLDRLIEIRS